MKPRRYETPAAFKRALEDRLKAGSDTGVDFARRWQLLVFDRFLVRVQDARQAPSPTAQAPCRQGLRLSSRPSGPAQAPHHPPHRPLWCRAQEPPGTLPLGGRTDALLAQPLPAPEDPLEHRADIHLAFLQLGCALISLRFLG